MDLQKHIELDNLSPAITGKHVDRMVTDALNFGLKGICVPPFWVKRAWREIAGRDVSLSTVAGYPVGFNMTETKILEAELAVRDGADAIDFVFHHSSFANGYPWTKIELAKASHFLHKASKFFQVAIDKRSLSATQLPAACKLAVDAGADYLTFIGGGDSWRTEEVRTIRGLVPSTVGLKLYSTVNSAEEAVQLIALGVDLLSMSVVDWLKG